MANKSSLWITNISKNIVSLGDLGICIYPYQSIDLYANSYHFTEQDIENSFTDGSLFKRSDKIVLRNIPPTQIQKLKYKASIDLEENPIYPTKIRSLIETKEEVYEELQLSDDDYAKENAEMAEIDDVDKFKKV